MKSLTKSALQLFRQITKKLRQLFHFETLSQLFGDLPEELQSTFGTKFQKCSVTLQTKHKKLHFLFLTKKRVYFFGLCRAEKYTFCAGK